MSVKNSVLYNVLLAISQVLFPLITFPYLARILGPEHIGALNFAESIAKYFVMLAALGIPIYGVREIAKLQTNKKVLSKLFTEVFLINFICTLFLTFCFLGAIFYVKELANDKLLFYWTLVYFFLQIFYLEWFFNGMSQFKYIAGRQIVIRFFFIGSVFVLIHTAQDYIKYMQMQVLLSIIIASINVYYLFKFIKIDKELVTSLNLKQHIKPILYLFLTIFSISIYFSLDTILLGFLADNESVGYYSSALKLNKLIIAVLGAITIAVFPSLVKLYNDGETAKFTKSIQDCFFLIVSLSLPIAFVLGTCASEVVYLLFGEGFERSVLPLQITTPLIVIVSMSSIFGFQVLNALSKDKAILISAIIGMVTSIVFSLLLIPMFKENGEAITILITELSVSVSFMYFTYKYFPIANLSTIFIKQLIGLVPYIGIIIFCKYFIHLVSIRLVVISVSSLTWFALMHFIISPNNLFKQQFDFYYNKLTK